MWKGVVELVNPLNHTDFMDLPWFRRADTIETLQGDEEEDNTTRCL